MTPYENLLAMVSRPGAARIRGTVVTEDWAPVSGAKVLLKQSGAVQLTDAEGKFLFKPLASGLYDIEVEAAGFVSQTENGIILDPFGSNAVTVVLVVV